jgi:hypothetical protein
LGRPDLAFGISNGGAEPLPSLDLILTGHQRIQGRIESFASGGSKKSDPAQVDPQDRRLSCTEEPGSA